MAPEAVAGSSARNQRGRPFRKGQSGNPDGKPKGTKNHATRIVEQLFDGEAEGICRAIVKKARSGDMTAAKIVVDRLCPPRRDRPVSFAMPPIEVASDAAKASAAIMAATAAGDITPDEASTLTKLIESHVRIVEAANFEQRLAEVERRLSDEAGSSEAPKEDRASGWPS